MSTWNCPICKAENPTPIHRRPEKICAACNMGFENENKPHKKEMPKFIKLIGGLGFFGLFISYAIQSGGLALLSAISLLVWYIWHEFIYPKSHF